METIKQICMFIVCAQMILHFKPSQKYEKYMKLLIGIMVLVQLFLPMMTWIYPESESELANRMKRYKTEVFGAIAGDGEKEWIDEEKISEIQIEEIKSILNNMDVESGAGTDKVSNNDKQPVVGEQSIIAEQSVTEVQENRSEGRFATDEITVERIEVKSGD